jgi:hypothetical protein
MVPMQFQLIRGQFEGQFIRNSGATLDDGAVAGSVTLAAAASPRAGTQGIRRCAGCRRGRLQATAAGPPRAANLTSTTGEFDLGARALVTTLVPRHTRPRCGHARLRAHHAGPGQPRSAPRAILPRAQARTGWLMASPASPATAGGCLLHHRCCCCRQPLTVCCLLPMPVRCRLPRLTCALHRLHRLTAATSLASGGVLATDTSSWPCSSASAGPLAPRLQRCQPAVRSPGTTRPRCGRTRLRAHHPGPGQPWSAPRAIWPRAQARTCWLVASPASPAAAGGCLLRRHCCAADSHCLLAAANAGCRD